MSGVEISMVHDDELLYRSVQDNTLHFKCSPGGALVHVSSSVFNDRTMKVSVDRALLREFQPERSKLSPEQGVLVLLTAPVRQSVIPYNDDKGRLIEELGVDVKHDPIPENDAHALVALAPELNKRQVFLRLKERLAELALQGGWALPPKSVLAS